MPQVTGPFEVKLTPQQADSRLAAAFLGRFNLDKTFSGPLEASSVGQMLASRSAVDGSAGYVAMEQVAGTLDGKAGSFVLQHSGHAARGEQSLTITVVADSGTGALTGLQGKMQIVIAEGGAHSYILDYELP